MSVWILHLETSTKVCSVALSENGILKELTEVANEEFSHAENLTLFVEDVLKKAGIALNTLSAVSVSSGPGSYTGLRIGVSTAKGFCYALNIPLIAVDSLFSLASIAAEKYTGLNLCPVIDARRMEVYNGIYSDQLMLLKEISADIIDETSYASFEPMVCFGDGHMKLKDVWLGRSVFFDDQIYSSARGQVKEAYKRFMNGQVEDVAYFEPFYLKDFIGTKPKV
ncbi:MAG: tRNA ((37)-N6)-threonylcarbamoyltransferase complex dimerization subunit type 1 TsaB [Bacteroidota bacterium]